MAVCAPWSIERRLLLSFTAGSAALLIGASFILYGAIRYYMNGRTETALNEQMTDALGDLSEPGGAHEVEGELAALGRGEPPYWIRILDAQGATAVETHGMSDRTPAREFPPAPGEGLGRREYRDAGGRWMSLASRAAAIDGKQYVIEIADDRSADSDFLRELRWMFCGLAASGLIFSAALASVVTRRGLQPLRRMESAVAHVSAPHLAERLGKEAWPRELAPLARAFDEMMDRLDASFSRLAQFSADLAHELRTPLANLRGEAEVALSRARTAEEYRAVLESSMEEYERLTEMAAKLLFLARADADEGDMNAQDLDARAIADELCALYEPYAEEHGVRLSVSGDARAKADATLLGRALANLIENALRYTPAGGAVSVVLHQNSDGGGAVISVMDTGCGISVEHLPRVFDRFYQADPSRRRGGAGLGLALVKSIMNLHGGAVEIESTPGEGTKVSLIFR